MPYPPWQQLLVQVAMVSSVSPSWVNTAPRRLSSSAVSIPARVLAMAVMAAVSSQPHTFPTSRAVYAETERFVPVPVFFSSRSWAHAIRHRMASRYIGYKEMLI